MFVYSGINDFCFRRRHHGRDHRHSSRSTRKGSEDKSKEAQKGIEVAKSRMRMALESARSQLSGLPTEEDTNREAKINEYEMSASEAASRHRDIERIDEGGFRPSSFRSTAGGAGGRVKKEDPTDHEAAIEKKQDVHDKAIFGPKWRDSIVKNEQGDQEEDITSIHKEIELANPRFSADPSERQARWLKIFRERRARVLCI
ncbi:hypothetical protein Tcan_03828 [Toxocara canis]|uniref:Uncharacterized protein n=1 Tax=Toxocara canis TaxID=6265 RepID=A0A0B2VH84_TOXCA|nr:hypothetical protein Tcan_03828 [Toxocara canis]